MSERAFAALCLIEDSAERNIWDAHVGCALLAGDLLVAKRLVFAEAIPAMNAVLSRIAPAPARAPTVDSKTLSFDEFSHATSSCLARDAAVPKELGHDVIYAAYVLDALHTFSIVPWQSLLSALSSLIEKIKAAGPGWITINGQNTVRPIPEASAIPHWQSWQQFAKCTRSASMEFGDMQLGHLLTHGHAVDLTTALAPSAPVAELRLAHGRRVQALGSANCEEHSVTPLPNRALDPRRAAYWELAMRCGDMHGHVVKYAYSFLSLRPTPSTAEQCLFGRIVWPNRASLAEANLR